MTTNGQSPNNPPHRNVFAKKPFLFLGGAVALLCVGLLAFKLIRDNTTITFNFLLDGKPLSVGVSPLVKVDGLPFTSGCTLAPGQHVLTAEQQDIETFTLPVRVYYGNKNLGDLPLESVKGAMLISVNPSPASVIVRHGIETVGNGSAPLNLGKLPLGTYELEVKHGEYRETHSVKIQGKDRVEAKIDLNLGDADLSSTPADAEFELTGSGRHWQGKLPTHIDDIPVGNYALLVSRKGWGLNEGISISRGSVMTNKTEFPYGSIEVTSDPTGMLVSTNGVEIEKTPLTLHEVKPGHFTLSASDGENDIKADITLGPKEEVKHTFVFRYGAVQLSSTPPGASIIRNGKELGKTPVTLNHIPVGELCIQMKLDGYVTTNIIIGASVGSIQEYTAKMISERYLQAMTHARETYGAAQYSESRKYLASALESEPSDPTALKLQADVVNAAEKEEEAVRVKQANDQAQKIASLKWLDFGKMVSDCTDTKQVQHRVVYNDGYYDNSGKFHKTGEHTEMHTETEHTFSQSKFNEKYAGKTYGFNCPDTWKVSKVEKDGSIIFKAGGISTDHIKATASMSNPNVFISMQSGQKVKIQAVVKKIEQGFLFRTLYLEDAEILN